MNKRPTRLTAPARTMPVLLFPLHCHPGTLYRRLTERDKPPVKYGLRCLKRPELNALSWAWLNPSCSIHRQWMDDGGRQAAAGQSQAACSSLTRPESGGRQNAGPQASVWEQGENNKASREVARRTFIRPPAMTPRFIRQVFICRVRVRIAVCCKYVL